MKSYTNLCQKKWLMAKNKPLPLIFNRIHTKRIVVPRSPFVEGGSCLGIGLLPLGDDVGHFPFWKCQHRCQHSNCHSFFNDYRISLTATYLHPYYVSVIAIANHINHHNESTVPRTSTTAGSGQKEGGRPSRFHAPGLQ